MLGDLCSILIQVKPAGTPAYGGGVCSRYTLMPYSHTDETQGTKLYAATRGAASSGATLHHHSMSRTPTVCSSQGRGV